MAKKPTEKRKPGRKGEQWDAVDLVRGMRALRAVLDNMLGQLAVRAGARPEDEGDVPDTKLAAVFWAHGAPVFSVIKLFLKQSQLRWRIEAQLVVIAFGLAEGVTIENLLVAATFYRGDEQKLLPRDVRRITARKDSDYPTAFGKQYALYRLLTKGSKYYPAAEALPKDGKLRRLFESVATALQSPPESSA